MSETVGSAGSGHPDLHLSAEEKQVYSKLLREADPDGFGAVSGDIAVKFFERTRLPADVLGQIWQIADTQNRGFLTPAGFGVVLRLIGHAQSGRAPSAQLATQPAPLPQFDGQTASLAPTAATATTAAPIAPVAPVAAATAVQPPATVATPPPSSPSVGPLPIRVPPLAPEKVAEYSQLFDKSGAENGLLSGVVAKQIFERARLPNELLGRIWALSDTRSRGALDVTEFVIAMHLLASYKSGQMRGVPSTLPAGLYEAATRRSAARTGAAAGLPGGSRPGSASPVPAIPLSPQFSGQSPNAPRQRLATPLSAQSTGTGTAVVAGAAHDGWAITPADKARFDAIFATVDKTGSGYVSGEQAVEFFGNARLPEEVLAQIWDLADINSEGRLSRDEFAVAMYLIRQQRATKDGRGSLPATLPPSLIPPSLRKAQPVQAPLGQVPPVQHAPSSPLAQQPAPKARSAAEDLFGLDAFGDAPSAQVPQSTGGTESSPFGPAAAAAGIAAAAGVAGVAGATAATSSTFKPFVPSSSFGQSLQPQLTGSQARGLATTTANDDLLGDTDPNESSKLTKETSELANLSNQVGSLSKQMTELEGQRSEAEQEISQHTAQRREFESRLGQLRALYEKEASQVKALQAQLQTLRTDTKRLQTDHAVIGATHQDLSLQHQQLRTQLEADQAENAALKEKIRQTNQEIEQLKPQLEKLKSDARQQKGLVAIHKKQLATNEAERDRLKAEMAAAHAELEHGHRDLEHSARQAESAKQELEEARSLHATTAAAAATKSTGSHSGTALAAAGAAALAAATGLGGSGTSTSTSTSTTSTGPESRSSSVPLASPALSTTSNPFFRSAAPAPATNQAHFDSIFGPSFSPATTPAPATSFVASSTESGRSVDALSTPPDGSSSHQDLSHDDFSSQDHSSRNLSHDHSQDQSEDASHQENVASADEEQESVRQSLPTASTRSVTPTPTVPTVAAGHVAGADGGHDFPLSAADEEQDSVKHTLPTHSADSLAEPAGMPGGFPDTPNPAVDTAKDQVSEAVPPSGAADTAGGTAGTSGSTAGAADKSAAADNFDHYFGSVPHKRTPSEQARDFDSAFAGLKPGTKANGTASKEFPDIQELDDDDDDDDDESSVGASRETPLGFEDSFNSPRRTVKGKEREALPAEQIVAEKTEQQSSLPTYWQAEPGHDHSHFPRDDKAFLAQQDASTAETHPTSGERSAAWPLPDTLPPSYQQHSGSGAGAIAGGAAVAGGAAAAAAAAPSHANANANAGFDFDSAFAGLAPAQVEEDDDDEDEDAFGTTTASAEPQFDPSFDSPAPTSSTFTGASSQHLPLHSGSPFAAAPAAAAAAAATTTSHHTATDGSTTPVPISKSAVDQFDFDKFEPAPAVASSSGLSSEAPKSHDWDDIFSGLSNGPSTATVAKGLNLDEPSTPTPTTATADAASAANATGKVPPPLTRAMSSTSEHDDPILKRLTAMGWSRSESLAALEKYDYNIDKAADYLTFKS